jgi:hypothetical protein
MNPTAKLHESPICEGLPRAAESSVPVGLISFGAFFKTRGIPHAFTFPTAAGNTSALPPDDGCPRAKAYVPEAAAFALPPRRPDRHDV